MLQTILIIVLIIFFVIGLVFSFLTDPNGFIVMFNIKPKTFRLYKPKEKNQYFLQLRVLFVYFFIYKVNDDYDLSIYSDKHSITYQDYLIANRGIRNIMKDRFEVIKFFSNTGNPEDKINL